jgi:3-deoxy-D-manno-octulosonic-acid transferase
MSLHAHYMTQQQQQSKELFDINAALSIGEVEKLTCLIRLLRNSKACVCNLHSLWSNRQNQKMDISQLMC